MPDLALETQFRAQGHLLIAGVDEAGRGPLAGPVAAAAVILPPDLTGDESWLSVIDDSKRLTETRRVAAAKVVHANALAWSVELVASCEIDRIGIGNAAIRAMMDAVSVLNPYPHALLLDWVPIKQCPLPHQTVVKGDAKSLSIAAASILAKVARDETMKQVDGRYPGYGFAQHKGYATAQHLRCLSELGPTPIHRRSFRPLRQARLLRDADVA
ncbi:MAG: ribonuclease HII [Dehalococcoidia bacterium]|nr:ribonuclease HII [Dehalococcoidia bacterium]